MKKYTRHRSVVRPVTTQDRPRWSVMIPTYHCAEYLRKTLESVLAQDPGPHRMQIEVVDDHSTADDPEAVVRRLAGNRVSFHRHDRNRGHVRTFNTCLARARGEIVHLLHGDDFVLPGFYEQLEPAFADRADVGAAFTRLLYLDEDGDAETPSLLERDSPGVIDEWLNRIAGGQRLAPPAMVVRRSVYERVGGFDDRITCAGEDWEMWVRIAAHYPVWFEPATLAVYRVKRKGALTDGAARTGRLARDMRIATEIVEEYLSDHLPLVEARRLTMRARAMYAGWSLEATEEMLEGGMWLDAARQAVETVRCHPRRTTLRNLTSTLRKSLSSAAQINRSNG